MNSSRSGRLLWLNYNGDWLDLGEDHLVRKSHFLIGKANRTQAQKAREPSLDTNGIYPWYF